MRNSSQRTLILEYLHRVKTHPTAAEVYDEVQQLLPDISFGTVYRNLNRLNDEGLIQSFKVGKAKHFDGNADNHYHFLCRRCGKVEDIEMALVEDIIENAQNATDNHIDGHKIFFTGYCQNCSQSKKGETNGNK